MTASHLVYGLRVVSSLTLPGLRLHLQSNSETFDVRISLKDGWPFPTAIPAFRKNLRGGSENSEEELPDLRAGLLFSGEHFGFFYSDGARFAVERRAREVWADWPENYTLEDACTYLVGPVMGFVLRLRGTVCLHASAVAVGDRAIALVGPAGSGKSTTAAAFACCGFPVLSDDIVALTLEGGQWLVQPGYPRVNLWPDSVRRLFGSEEALPHITPTWDKRYLPLGQDSYRFASSPLPLGAVYILDSRDSALTTPVVQALSAKEGLITLVANTYANYLLDEDMRHTEFDVLSRVVSSIPVRCVQPPEEASSIPDLCGAIAEDARRVMATIPASAASVLG